MTQWYRRVFRRAPRDPITEQLRDLERQGAGEARAMHVLAFVLVIAFSLGALIVIAADPLQRFWAAWLTGAFNFVEFASFVVSGLLVIGADFSLLWASRVVIIKLERGLGGKAIHITTIVVVAGVDALTFLAMSVLYDRPSTAWLWTIIIIRAFVAPYVMVYLRMARAQTLGAEDMLYQAERATGEGVVRKMVLIARDQKAPLERVLALWRAAARMKPATLAQVDALMDAERATRALASVTGLTQEFAPFINEVNQAQALPALSPKATTPSVISGYDDRYAVAAHPSRGLPNPTAPRSKPPEPTEEWGGPDDDGPGGGVVATEWDYDTAEHPALAVSMNGNGHHNASDWPSDSGDDEAELDGDVGELRVSRKRPPMSKTERAAFSAGKELMRSQIATQYVTDSPNPNPGGLRKALRTAGLGTNDGEAARLLRVARGEEPSRWERATKRDARRANDAQRFYARAAGMSDG